MYEIKLYRNEGNKIDSENGIDYYAGAISSIDGAFAAKFYADATAVLLNNNEIVMKISGPYGPTVNPIVVLKQTALEVFEREFVKKGYEKASTKVELDYHNYHKHPAVEELWEILKKLHINSVGKVIYTESSGFDFDITLTEPDVFGGISTVRINRPIPSAWAF